MRRVGCLGHRAAARRPRDYPLAFGTADPVAYLLAGDDAVRSLDRVPVGVPVRGPVRLLRGRAVPVRGMGRLHDVGGSAAVAPGEALGELDLLEMHGPRHGDDAAGDARRAESEDGRDDGLTDVRRCRHGIPPSDYGSSKASQPALLKHMIESNGSIGWRGDTTF